MAAVKPDLRDVSIVGEELRSTIAASNDSEPIVMPLPQTVAMMERLYKTDQALQRARH